MTNYRIPFAKPMLTDDDKRAVMAVLDRPILTNGPEVRALEEEFSEYLGPSWRGPRHCVAVSSCWAALHLGASVYCDDLSEFVVRMPALTHVATAHAIDATAAEIQFVDTEFGPQGNLYGGFVQIDDKRTHLTINMPFAGIPHTTPNRANPEYTMSDNALGLGAKINGRHAGCDDRFCTYSFYPTKHLTGGEGGMLTCLYADDAKEAKYRRGFGVVPDGSLGRYDVEYLGYNLRMTEIQAALIRSQLKRIDETLHIRKNNWTTLRGKLINNHNQDYGTVLSVANEMSESSYYCLVLHLRDEYDRDIIRFRLAEAGIETSIYYPKPVPFMSYYRQKYNTQPHEFPNAQRIAKHSIAFPVGTHLSPADIDYIAQEMKKAIQQS